MSLFLFCKLIDLYHVFLDSSYKGCHGLLWWLSSKKCRFNPWVRKIPWKRKSQPIPVFLPREFHGQRSLAGYSPWGHKESDTTEATKHSTEHKGCPVMFLLLCLTLLSMTISRSIPLVANGIISLFNAWIISIVYINTYHTLLSITLVSGLLGCFHVLAIVIMLQWILEWMYPFRPCFSPDICPECSHVRHT